LRGAYESGIAWRGRLARRRSGVPCCAVRRSRHQRNWKKMFTTGRRYGPRIATRTPPHRRRRRRVGDLFYLP
ncbi:unnamed protein product, partial [Amoebophrya sp. A120]